MTDMTAVDVLREARDLIADPDHWTRRAGGRDKDGNQVAPASPDACQWCMSGARDAAMLRARTRVPLPAWTSACCVLQDRVAEKGHRYLPDFNDHPDTTHADVLAAYDAAIQFAEGLQA